jgi:small subunit ribosomal protein S3Ae
LAVLLVDGESESPNWEPREGKRQKAKAKLIREERMASCATDYVNNRVFEQSHQDLSQVVDHAYRIFRWKSVAVANEAVLTVFYGMRLTADKLGSLLRKYRTLIDAHVDVKTPDGYVLRLFSVAFTKKINQKKACYAQQSKRKQIREVCKEAMKAAGESEPIDKLCVTIVNEDIEKQITAKCEPIFQVESVIVSKVKVLKAPAFTPEVIEAIHKKHAVTKPAEAARPAEEEPAAAPQAAAEAT